MSTSPSANTTPPVRLLPQHAKILHDSRVSEDIARQRGYWSETSQAALARLGFARSQCITPCLVTPLMDLDGEIVSYQIRADKPRIVGGKPATYENPKGSRLPIDVPPAVRTQAVAQEVPLFITVGVRQADAAASRGLCCIALLNIQSWKNQEPFWNRIPLERRSVYVVADSRVATNPPAAEQTANLFSFLAERHADVHFVALPPGENGQKVALDDYLAAGHSAENLVSLAVTTPPRPPDGAAFREESTGSYEVTDEGIFKVTVTEEGEIHTQLTNFDARIVAEIDFVNGDRVDKEFEIEARLAGERKTVCVPAAEYEEMKWVVAKLGAAARIEEGFNKRDAARAAIQWLSAPVPVFKGVRTLGWHFIDGRFVYVHAGGIIAADSGAADNHDLEDRSSASGFADRGLRSGGPKGPISQMRDTASLLRVRIPRALSAYSLPPPPSGPALAEDILKSMRLLGFGPYYVTVPLYGAIWRAILDTSDFSISINGTTGQSKSERASLYLQHFGAELDARNPVTTWRDTPNYRIAIMAAARHVLVHEDDLVFEGPRGEINRTYREAADFFRGQGNAAGRGRCNPDGTPRAPAPPEGLPISTGETSLPGQSLNSRIVNIDLPQNPAFDLRNEETSARLSTFQRDAREGAFARVTSAFIKWLAPRYEEMRQQMHEQAAVFRKDLFLSRCSHPRTATAMAELLASLEIIFGFLVNIGFIDESSFEFLWGLAHDGLYAACDHQGEHQTEEDPAHRFLDLLATALATGYAYVAYLAEDEKPGDALGDPQLWGYEVKTRLVPKTTQLCAAGDGGALDSDTSREVVEYEERIERRTRGRQVGWKLYDNLYFEPKSSLAVVNCLAEKIGQHPIPLGPKALAKRLAEGGFLESSAKGRNTARVPIHHAKKDVLHIMTWRFVEFHRTDEDWAAVRDEEALLAHERYIKRQRERDVIRRRARKRAHDFMQDHFIDLLPPQYDVLRHVLRED